MLVLAVESATETAAVALADETGALGSVVVDRGRRHTETLAPAIESLCRRSGVSLPEIDLIAVDVGPGLFTGLRVGVGTVKALAFALGVPVVAATSLEILAHALAGSGLADGRLIVPVVDARRGEVFSNRFRPPVERAPDADDGSPVGVPVALASDALWAPDALAADLDAHLAATPAGPLARLVLAGDGARRYAFLFRSLPGVALAGPDYAAPPVTALAHLGVAQGLAGAVQDGASVLPRYMRQADARINWEQRIAPRAPTPAGG